MNKMVIIVVVVILVIGGGIFVFTRGSDTEETSTNTATVTNTTTTTNTNTATANQNTSITANTNTTPVTNTTTNTTTSNTNATTNELSDSEKPAFIEQLVQTATSGTTFPFEADQVTTVTGIVAKPAAILYQYTLHDIDESLYSDELLKNNVTPSLCQTPSTRNDILDRGIAMEYSYQVENSTQTYFFSVSKEDCI